jgi:hypothetical protein
MAGLGFKAWSAGDVLAAGDVNGYLADQVVQVHASAGARGSAIGTAVSEGMIAYTTDDNTLAVYNGSQWGQVAQAVSPNYVINGAFDIWQRGTSFDVVYFNSGNQNHSDRWQQNWDNAPTAVTVSRQTFTPGELTVAGFGEEEFYYRSSIGTVGSNTNWRLTTRIEDVRTLAGQTVTVSFWAKTDSARNIIVELTQNFGSGGSTQLNFSPTTVAATTTWQRFSVTVNVPSISGKTIGAGNHLRVNIRQASASGSVMDVWGVQLEAGSVATPFRRNANNLQGELAACKRYYDRRPATDAFTIFSQGAATATTGAVIYIQPHTPMRTKPSSIEFGNLALSDGVGALVAVTNVTFVGSTTGAEGFQINAATASGLTQFRPYSLLANNNVAGHVAFSAEL